MNDLVKLEFVGLGSICIKDDLSVGKDLLGNAFESFFRIGPAHGVGEWWFRFVQSQGFRPPSPSLSPQVVPIAPIRPCWVVLLPLFCRCRPHLLQHLSRQIHSCTHSRSCFPSWAHVGPLPTHDWYNLVGSDGQHCVELRTLSRRERLPVSPMVFLKDLSQRRKLDNDLLHESLPGTLWRCICGSIGLYPSSTPPFPRHHVHNLGMSFQSN